jgi:hypothetical protein
MAQDLVAKYTEWVKDAFSNSTRLISKCSSEIYDMDGMSGTMTRSFYNNIASSGEDIRYLEVGSWKGSSTCAALCKNSIDIVSIDNWSEFGGPKEEFLNNIQRFTGDNRLQVIEQDSFAVDVSQFSKKFNVYLYDGEHSVQSHTKALTHFVDAMDDVFVFIVDDWDWKDTQIGTCAAIETLGLIVEYFQDTTGLPGGGYGFWNGTGAFVLRKP